MSDLARLLARHCWFWMLYLMRRPWMKRLQRWWLRRMPEKKRAKAWASVVRQNRFARRHGLSMLAGVINLFLASVMVTVVYYAALALLTSGALDPPQRAAAASYER